MEHVGSTSVPGLAAKPIIAIDVVVPSRAEIPATVERLADLGYAHSEDLGIEDREAFESPVGLPAHHLFCLHLSPKAGWIPGPIVSIPLPWESHK